MVSPFFLVLLFSFFSWGERKSVWPQRKLVFQASQRIAGRAVTTAADYKSTVRDFCKTLKTIHFWRQSQFPHFCSASDLRSPQGHRWENVLKKTGGKCFSLIFTFTFLVLKLFRVLLYNLSIVNVCQNIIVLVHQLFVRLEC